jgi:hypothetical protein
MIYDDGSTIDDSGLSTAAPAGMLLGDVYDSQHMGPVSAQYSTLTGTPASVPWWQQAMQYGIVRAIDNRFAQPQVAGNVYPGSFGGYNGRTYLNGAGQPIQAGAFGMDPLLLILLVGGVAFLALKG